jgi:hypothetical protein
MIPRSIPLLLVLAAACSPAFAAEPPLSSYTVTRTTGTITIDGKFDEADWKRAQEFTLTETNTGKPVPLKSTVKFLWDDQFLYAAFFCEDPDAWATLTQEDDPLWGEEVVELFIDPDGNIHNYYEVEFNPVNARVDLAVINGGERTKGSIQGWFEWDYKNMKNAAFVEGDGLKEGTRDKFWQVEIAVPYEDMLEMDHVPPRDGDTWRLNAYRIERGKSGKTPEDDWYAAFSPTLRGSFHTPWRFGTIVFRK